MESIRGVLLDVDGTLLDSNDAHARAWVDALAEVGEKADVDQLRKLIGMGADNLLPELGIDEDSDRGKRASDRKKAIFAEKYLAKLAPTRGARALVERFAKDHLARIVATSAGEDEVRALLRAAKVEDLIDGTTTASDAESSKPDPDIVKAAIARAKLPPESLIMLGDTPYDVEAARKSGVPIVALRSGGFPDAELSGAAAIYDDPADLLARYASSPFAR